MVKVAQAREFIECTLGEGEQIVYLSHPLTTGGVSIAENVSLAKVRARGCRNRLPGDVVLNPTSLGPVEGWSQETWMELWLPLIRERAKLVVMAPGWTNSVGCRLERDCALEAGVDLVSYAALTEN